MRVQDLMSKELVTLDAATPLPVVYQSLRRHAIRHVLLTDKGKLVGILSERDLRETRSLLEDPVNMWEFAYHVASRPARDLIKSPPTTVGVNDSVEQAAQLLVTGKIGALPVMDDDKLVGILTTTDILNWVAHSKCPA